MAEYTVPQDVEADDKLLGPFTARQLVYLFILVGCVGLAWILGQVFIPFAIVPVPFIILFGALALPIRKDQPMETYLVALISFYTKPHKRLWTPGLPESTIEIAAPKKNEGPYIRSLSSDEVSHRLSFLSNLVDESGRVMTQGGQGRSSLNSDVLSEANSTQDIYEAAASNYNLNQMMESADELRHKELVAKMTEMIKASESPTFDQMPTIARFENRAMATAPPPSAAEVAAAATSDVIDNNQPQEAAPTSADTTSIEEVPAVAQSLASDDDIISAPVTYDNIEIAPVVPVVQEQPTPTPAAVVVDPAPTPTPAPPPAPQPVAISPAIKGLAEQKDLSIATLARQAQRIKEKQQEVFVSLRGNH